tara:strand:+ start:2344 stop:2514 length:171 start_codon:yes stop_codon:yes gene_type:complete
MIEIKNPSNPKIPIPIAETFATVRYSFLDGFLRACQTRLLFMKNDFADVANFFTID